MLLGRSPLRISFVGGGTDLEEYHKQYDGYSISATIDKFTFVAAKLRADKTYQGLSPDYHTYFSSKKLQGIRPKLGHEIAITSLREMNFSRGIDMFFSADVAPGSGLGASSSLASNIVNILYGASLMIALVTIPLMANTILMKSPMEGGLILSRLTIAIPIGAVLGGILIKNLDRRIPSIAALAMCGSALLLMQYWDQNIKDPLMSIHLIIAGLGFGLIIAPVTLTAVNSGGETMRGATAGIITTSRFIGMTLGISAIAAWGSGRFKNLLLGVEVPMLTAGETTTQMSTRLDEFQSTITGIGVSIFSDFYQTAGILCILAIFPCLFMKNESASY